MGALREGRRTYRVAISGYYGFRNSGDEAVLRSIVSALREEARAAGVRIEPVVLSVDPAWTRSAHGVEAAHRMRPAEVLRTLRGCDALISGGGSLLQDATGALTIPYYTGIVGLARMLRKPVFIYAQGIGPVRRAWLRPLVRFAMNASRVVTVRDGESAALLERFGVARERIGVVPDPVMGLDLPDGEEPTAGGPDGAGVPVVGVSVRRWRPDGADLERVAEALAALARRRAVRLRFLPMHLPDDAEASRAVMEHLAALGFGQAAELAEPGDDPQRMLLEVGRCSLVFGMRLHALIYAANRGVPMFGLSYDPKIDHFLARLGLKPVGTTDGLDAEAFAAAADALLGPEGAAAWRKRHGPAIEALRRDARRPARLIIEALTGPDKG
ncbi:MAG: polysaccharide pyruvyl transferase CsaB [Thermobacillus sp. ZCTH02-B1]|mgnify:CR=1 FL=1|uniref:polysaccharide pyruvyl transferase CsaB n=1 Tax=Thermobacillus sp. ZCTH02-B1 TaxID=1858795 RepID=UPI000B5657DE|nr:polysaccharide pyruvyl transferase CsaB [Thermobacillus sp. ZCTH02-B1]OUM94951.1 MAG: polysaccharide pyruvyl transferase CsaB [Thermobacillus sp. ZCTH02-B1]